MRDNGGVVHPAIKVKYMFEDNRWLQVKDFIKKNEQLIKVPNACLMTSREAKNQQFGEAIWIKKKDFSDVRAVMLSVWLMQEIRKKEQSFYWPWISILPKASNHPYFHTEEDMACLEGTYFLKDLRPRKEAYANDFKILSEMAGFDFSLDEYMYATVINSTRAFLCRITNELFFCPVSDMRNHCPGFDHLPLEKEEEKTGYHVTTTRAIEAEEQLPICYGDMHNALLYMKEGFHFVEPADHNVTQITLHLNEQVPHLDEKANMVAFNSYAFDGCRMNFNPTGDDNVD